MLMPQRLAKNPLTYVESERLEWGNRPADHERIGANTRLTRYRNGGGNSLPPHVPDRELVFWK